MCNTRCLVIILTMLLQLQDPTTASDRQRPRVIEVDILNHVHASILNRLGNGQNMTVHCRSGDDDLGQQTVVEGSEYAFDFTVNIIGSTVFFCDLGWNGNGDFQFDVFDYGRDMDRCKSQCLWIAAEEGVYGFNGLTGLWEYMYRWI